MDFSTSSIALKTALEQLTAGCKTNCEKFERLAHATTLMCDPFPIPDVTNADVLKDRLSVDVPTKFKTRMTGDTIRVCLVPGVDELPDNRMSDILTLMRILVKYRTNMPDVVWAQLYEIALKNFIHTVVDESTKNFFRELLNDPTVRALIEKMDNDDQDKTEKN